MIIKNCVLFTNCISKVNNIRIDNAKDTDILMSMYNIMEYSDNHSKASGSLWHYYRHELFQLMVLLLIFLLITIAVLRLNLKQK